MYKQIKQLADEAVALQNKDRMDAALREIVVLCGQADSIDHGFVYAGGEHLEKGARNVAAPAAVLAAAEAGDSVQITSISYGSDNETITSLTVAPLAADESAKAAVKASAKKRGAK